MPCCVLPDLAVSLWSVVWPSFVLHLLPDLASSFWPSVFWAKLFFCGFCYYIEFCLIWQYILDRGSSSVLTFLWHLIFCLYRVSPLYVILPFSCLLLVCFLLFLVDVLQSGIWSEANSLVDPSLRRLVPNLLHLQLESRALSTVQKYRAGWLKWRQWAASKIGVQVIPASLCMLRSLLASLL